MAIPFLTIVIPAFNESHRLPDTLAELRAYLLQQMPSHEVIVVDDGSTDETARLVQAAAAEWPALRLLRQPGNRGKGAAVRRGCLEARGELVLYMDADLATPVEDVPALLSQVNPGERRAVVGVRTYQENEGRWRRVLGLCAQLLAHLLVFEKAVIDSQCAFKCFPNAVAKELFSLAQVDGGMFDVELFFLMHRRGIPVYYQPVHWSNKAGSRINIPRCILLDPLDLLAIRWRGWWGSYDRVGAKPCPAADRP